MDYIETCLLTIISESYDFKTKESKDNLIQIKKEENNIEKKDNPIPVITNEIKKDENINVSRETLIPESDKKFILNDDYIIQLLVGANKKIKLEDIEKMKQLSMYISDLNYGKYANSLKNMKVLASSDTYMIVVLKSDLEVKNVNNIQNEEGYEKFTNVILGKPKKIFAMDFNQYNQTMDTFRRLSASLPEPAIVHVNYDENHMNIDKTEENLMKVFNDLEIIDD